MLCTCFVNSCCVWSVTRHADMDCQVYPALIHYFLTVVSTGHWHFPISISYFRLLFFFHPTDATCLLKSPFLLHPNVKSRQISCTHRLKKKDKNFVSYFFASTLYIVFLTYSSLLDLLFSALLGVFSSLFSPHYFNKSTAYQA